MDRHNSERPAVVFAGGDLVGDVPELPDGALVIAADSGLDAAFANGIQPDLIVGDLDSASQEAVIRAQRAGIDIERHPIDKDATDLELALGSAVRRGVTSILVLGGYGGRLDHFLANALLLAAPMFAGVAIEWRTGHTTVTAARAGVPVELVAEPGDLVSLLPIGGTATGVTTQGLRWPLYEEALHTGSTRGVSNRVATSPVRISVSEGVVLTIHERTMP